MLSDFDSFFSKLFMKSQIFLFIKVALSGREAAERFSISLFLQSNWGARKWSGPLCFLFCHDEKENSIVFVFDIIIAFVTAGQFHQPTCYWNLSLSLPMIESRPVANIIL